MAELMVGGAFLSAVLNVLFDRLASRQVVDFFRNRKLDEKLLMRFKTALLTVNVVLDDAEAKEVTRPAVKQWHEELKHVVYQAEDVLDEIVTKASKPKTGKFNASMFDFSNKKLDASRVEDIVARIEYIASQKQLLGLHEGVKDNSIHRGQTSSLVESCVYGRDDDKQKIIKSVLMDVAVGDQIPVIAIVGMGGIGKTTLAQMVYNDEKVEDYFDIKAWVCVTEEFDIFRITKIVLETVTSNHSTDITDLNLLQLKLKQVLLEKKILLVLDDVWNEDYSKWRMLCVPFTNVSPGSKIIVTTRNDGVASIMRTLPSYSLEHLSQDDSWKLFTHHAFEARSRDGYPHLEVIGKQIVEKCKGLPLAIKSLGGVLRNKDDVKVWENVMTSEIWDLATGTTSILPALRLSYHYLPTHLKRCFAYCSIFPQDYEFEKMKLVLLWMAEGFVIDNTNKSLEELGEEYFDELFARSFFQISSGENGTFFVMHDLNNDLARDISGEFCLTLERGKTCQLSEKVRHFLYSQNKYDDDSKLKPILNSKHMRTFLQVKQLNTQFLYISNTIIRDLLPKLSCVRVLSLSYYNNVVELPDSIFTLIHLRYLDLSHTNIRYLPNTICQLYNLQTLLLSNCRKLVKLPENLGELVNLRHLDISETSICKMPLRIRMLASLQTLSTFIVDEENCSRLGELKGFRYLKGSLSVMGLHNVKNVEDVIEANLKEKVGIEKLRFEWGRETEVSENQNHILDNLQPCANLTQLVLEGYSGTRLSNWLGNGSLFNLAYLQINNCVNCSSLPPLGQLPSLVGLRVTGMKSVRRVGSEFYGNGPSSVKSFKKLAILKFEGMYEWEEWSSSGGSIGDYDFPELKILWIKDCPKLCGNLPKVPPSLHDLLISECGELTVIIPGDASLRSLKLEGCKNLESMSKSFPNGMMKNCNNLDQLRIGHWPSLTHFPDDGLPVTSLRIFEIEYCNKLEFLPKETFHSYKYLEKLNLFKSCDSMISFPIGLFPSLKYVEMSHCDKLRNFQTAPAPSLYSIDIMDCKSLKSLPEGMNTLEFLRISNCEELESLPEGMNNLELLRISNCEELESFPVGGLPSNLQYLIIRGCKKMMAKRREWGLHTLAFLKFLEIEGCEEVETFPEEDCRLPTSLAIIYLERLPKLKRIEASRLLKLTSLVDLGIKHCPKVKPVKSCDSHISSVSLESFVLPLAHPLDTFGRRGVRQQCGSYTSGFILLWTIGYGDGTKLLCICLILRSCLVHSCVLKSLIINKNICLRRGQALHGQPYMARAAKQDPELKQCKDQCRVQQHFREDQREKCEEMCEDYYLGKQASEKTGQDPEQEQEQEEELNPYVFEDRHFSSRFKTEHGRISVLQKFTEKSKLLKGIENYRLEILEANPSTFIFPAHFDAEALFLVLNGRGTIKSIRQHEKSESFNIKSGDLIRIGPGIQVYMINRDDNQKLYVAKLLQPVSTPGHYEAFLASGSGENPQSSFYGAFSTELLEAAFKVKRDQLEKVFGKQRQGVIVKASKEQIKALSQHDHEGGMWPFGEYKSGGPFNLFNKRPLRSNQFGRFHVVNDQDYKELHDLAVEVSFANITKGAMEGPFYLSKATKISFVLDGEGYFEMACPHVSSQSRSRGRQGGRGSSSEKQQQGTPTYHKITSRLKPGTVFVVPAGHPVAIVASTNKNLQVVCFEVNAKNNERFSLAGKKNLVSQFEKEAKELAFGVSSDEVDQVFGNNNEEFFFPGPRRQQREWELRSYA